MLASARDAYLTQQRLSVAAVAKARQVAAQGTAQVARVIAGFQLLAAQQAAQAVPAMLSEQGASSTSTGTVAATALAGVASNGLPLVPLLDSVQTSYGLSRFVATQVQDAGRAAASVAITARPEVSGYVRMLNPPSCSRCAVLAGKWFKWNAGFERHPNCDCIHIPAAERSSDWHGDTINPEDYFHSLPTAADLDARYPNMTVRQRQKAGLYSQEDIFTRAGAQAIRDGADMGQVVNARRGMQKAQIFGHKAWVTTEGTKRHGLAFQALQRGGTAQHAEEWAWRHTKRGLEQRRVHRTRARSPRLMPETLYAVAKDRQDAIRLLKAHGYLL